MFLLGGMPTSQYLGAKRREAMTILLSRFCSCIVFTRERNANMMSEAVSGVDTLSWQQPITMSIGSVMSIYCCRKEACTSWIWPPMMQSKSMWKPGL